MWHSWGCLKSCFSNKCSLSLSVMFPSLTGHKGAEGPGPGEDHDGSGQESERRPEEETVCGHRHSRRSQGTCAQSYFSFFESRHQSFSDNVGLWLFLSDPALRRAHGRHGPLLQAPGVVSAEESPGRQSHCAQHALHGRGRHPCWYECSLLCKIHKPTLWTGNIDQKLCFILILDDGISGSSSLINILIRSWCCRTFSVFSWWCLK